MDEAESHSTELVFAEVRVFKGANGERLLKNQVRLLPRLQGPSGGV